MEYNTRFATLRTCFRVLTFRAGKSELTALDHRHLAVGLALTWLVGMGRHWDVPAATFVQASGLVSIAFVLGLAAVVWATARPFGPANWSYRRVLTCLTLAAPPAALYAVPVERWFDPAAAEQFNVAFMALVSVWRLGLLVFLLRRMAGLTAARALVATLLPVSIVVAALTAFRLDNATFRAMAGLSADGPITALASTAVWAASRGFTALLPLLLASILWWNRRRLLRFEGIRAGSR